MANRGCSLVFLLALALASCQRATDPGQRDELPADWDIEALASAVPPDLREHANLAGSATYVLAWKIRQSECQVTREECVVVKRFGAADGPQRWVLAAVYRHPPGNWHQFEIQVAEPQGHAHVVHRRDFMKCPTNSEVYDFIDTYGWKLGPESGWCLIRGEICRRTWKQVIGEEPTRLF